MNLIPRIAHNLKKPKNFLKNTNICLTFIQAMLYNAAMHLKRSISQLNKRAFYESIR